MDNSLLLVRKNSGLTYAQFSKYITDRYPIRSWSSNINNPGARIASIPLSGSSGRTMLGSPWGSYCGSNSGLDYVFMHCCPNMAVRNEIINTKRYFLLLPISSGVAKSVTGLNRNGYTSFAGTPNPGFSVEEFVYWDESLQKAMTLNPFLMSTPVEFIPS